MSTKPVLVVLGATGNQGGSVLTHFLTQSSSYTLRGVTRNPSSPAAAAWTAKGVEMVAADFDDRASLDAAFAGASAIFSVTDYWQTFFNPAARGEAAATGANIGIFSREKEARQNRNIIDAAAAVPGLQRFVFSSLAHASKTSGGKYSKVYHFDGKAQAEEYGQKTYPDLWAKTNVLYAGFYLENFLVPTGALFRPKLNKAKDTLVLLGGIPIGTTPIPLYSVGGDTGALVDALLRARAGFKVMGVAQWLTLREFTALVGKATGKKVEVVDSLPPIVMGDATLEEDYADMIGFMAEFLYDGSRVDKTVVQPKDLGVEVKLGSVEEWVGKQDWLAIIESE